MSVENIASQSRHIILHGWKDSISGVHVSPGRSGITNHDSIAY